MLNTSRQKPPSVSSTSGATTKTSKTRPCRRADGPGRWKRDADYKISLPVNYPPISRRRVKAGPIRSKAHGGPSDPFRPQKSTTSGQARDLCEISSASLQRRVKPTAQTQVPVAKPRIWDKINIRKGSGFAGPWSSPGSFPEVRVLGDSR